MVKSGLVYSFGMGFWGPNGHDGIWHIALINQLAKGSLEMPIFAGEQIKNYHFFYDALLALIHRITMIPAHTLYFQIFPPLIALSIGILTYEFVFKWRRSKDEAFWAVFFVYFGSSFGWIVTFFRHGSIGGESMFWSQQSLSTLINPPYALSLVFLLLGLTLFLNYQNKPAKKLLILQTLVFGLLIQVKAYAGVIALCGLGAAALWSLRKKDSRNLKVFLSSTLVAIAVFLPTNSSSGNLFVFSPFWFPETMVSFSDRFNWPRLASAISSYKSGENFVKLVPAEILALSIFWFGNLGTRVLKEVLIFKWVVNWKKLDSLQVLLLSMLVVGIVLPLLFIQRGNPWNTIQFIYYSLFFSSVLAGIYLGEIIKSNVGKILAAFLVIFSVPATWATLQHYIPERPPAMISQEELKALDFLKKQPQGVVLTYPFNPELRKSWDTPQPLSVYETTSYVAAFSQKSVYLEDEMNLEITGYDWKEKRQVVEQFFVRGLLPQGISYIYLVQGQELPKEINVNINEIYIQDGIRIYRVL